MAGGDGQAVLCRTGRSSRCGCDTSFFYHRQAGSLADRYRLIGLTWAAGNFDFRHRLAVFGEQFQSGRIAFRVIGNIFLPVHSPNSMEPQVSRKVWVMETSPLTAISGAPPYPDSW